MHLRIKHIVALLVVCCSCNLRPAGLNAGPPTFTSKIAGNKQVYFAFTEAEGAGGYNVYGSAKADGDFELLAGMNRNRRAYHQTGLQNGTSYYYKVSAVIGDTEVFTDVFALTSFLPETIRQGYYDPADPKHGYSPGDGYLGMSLPGNWRPYNDDSHWNVPLSQKNVKVVGNSEEIIRTIIANANNGKPRNTLAFSNQMYTFPIHVVNSDNVEGMFVESIHYGGNIFDAWDKDGTNITDIKVPLTTDMWCEQNEDGHLIIVDPFKMIAWEFSRFAWRDATGKLHYKYVEGSAPTCSTFNVWDLTGSGTSVPFEGCKWQSRGARGPGFPALAGLIRPEEIAAGKIEHALIYSFIKNRSDTDGRMFAFPAVRSDGKAIGQEFPIEGSALRLPARVTEKDFDAWGLNEYGRIIARAIRDYGMYNGDNSGNFKIQAQLLDTTDAASVAEWNAMFPGISNEVAKIPVTLFEVVTTGPIYKYHVGEIDYPSVKP